MTNQEVVRLVFCKLQEDDAFGYIGQLIGYSEGLKKKPGGWIVVNKNNGEVLCMEAKVNKSQKQAVLDQMKMKADALDDGWKFRRCFRPEDDFFNRKYTNSKKLPMSCVFCDFRSSCWPNAKLLPQPKSKAKGRAKAKPNATAKAKAGNQSLHTGRNAEHHE